MLYPFETCTTPYLKPAVKSKWFHLPFASLKTHDAPPMALVAEQWCPMLHLTHAL